MALHPGIKRIQSKGAKAAVVFVTAPNRNVARSLAAAALHARLAACANLLAGVESHYWWKGKLNRGSETLIIFKTTQSSLKQLEKLILAKHPYDTPEFVALGADVVTGKYARWIMDCCSGAPE